jgi:hypothetical protein
MERNGRCTVHTCAGARWHIHTSTKDRKLEERRDEISLATENRGRNSKACEPGTEYIQRGTYKTPRTALAAWPRDHRAVEMGVLNSQSANFFDSAVVAELSESARCQPLAENSANRRLL